MPCSLQGNISIKTFHNGDSSVKTMENVLYSNELKCNLMSIRTLTKRGYKVVFEGDSAIVSLNGVEKFVARAKGNLYEVEFHVERNVFAGIAGEDNLKSFSQDLWHFDLVT